MPVNICIDVGIHNSLIFFFFQHLNTQLHIIYFFSITFHNKIVYKPMDLKYIQVWSIDKMSLHFHLGSNYPFYQAQPKLIIFIISHPLIVMLYLCYSILCTNYRVRWIRFQSMVPFNHGNFHNIRTKSMSNLFKCCHKTIGQCSTIIMWLFFFSFFFFW